MVYYSYDDGGYYRTNWFARAAALAGEVGIRSLDIPERCLSERGIAKNEKEALFKKGFRKVFFLTQSKADILKHDENNF